VAVKATITERLPAGSLLPYVTLVIAPFQIEIAPASCDALGLVNAIVGSGGITPGAPATQGEMPEHGAAVVSVRSYDVR
jgi:hypothetical protein